MLVETLRQISRMCRLIFQRCLSSRNVGTGSSTHEESEQARPTIVGKTNDGLDIPYLQHSVVIAVL